ncbi:MAG TPA: DUF167 domain-containing protein [Acidimicrobiales bacterium]|nr:DUF167 domain-containing protein [Acidimicrobiales bacterium]
MADDLFDVSGSDEAPVLHIRVMVHPGAGRTEVVGQQGDAVKVRVAAPPVEGRANRAVVELMADLLGAKPAQVEVESGESSRAKRLRVEGVDPAHARRILTAALERSGSRASGRRAGPPPGPRRV